MSEIGKLLKGVQVEWKTLGEIGEVRMCKRIFKEETSDVGEIPFYKIGTFGKEPNAYISKELFEEYKSKYNYPRVGEVLISASGTIGRSVIFDGSDAYFQDSNIVWIENDESLVLNKYLFYAYQIVKWEIAEGGTIQRLYNDSLKKTKIPYPCTNNPNKSLSIQQEIVRILDTFTERTETLIKELTTELEARKKQYNYYREKLLSFEEGDVEWKTLDEIAVFRRGSFPQPYGYSEWYDGEGAMPFVQVVDVGYDMKLVKDTKNKISKLAQPKSVFVPKGTVIVTLQGSIGRVAITQYDSYVDRTLAIFEQFQIEIDKKYFAYQLQEKFRVEKETARGDIIKTITKEDFKKFQIPIPTLVEQERIVAILDKLDSITTSISEALSKEIALRNKQYGYYRDLLLTFPKDNVKA